MKFQLNAIKEIRNNMLKVIEGLSPEQLSNVPSGYNNNIYWNFCHNAVTQDILCYKLSGVGLTLNEDLVSQFCKASKPNDTSITHLDYFKSIYISQVDTLAADYAAGKFSNFTEYPTSFGVTLRSVEDAIAFNAIHEGIHLGYIMAMKH